MKNSEDIEENKRWLFEYEFVSKVLDEEGKNQYNIQEHIAWFLYIDFSPLRRSDVYRYDIRTN